MQTIYPKRKPAKPFSHYILSITLLAIMVLLVNALQTITIPDPLGEKIQLHMKTQKSAKRG